MSKAVRRVLERFQLDGLAVEFVKLANRLVFPARRRFGRVDRQLVERYFGREGIRKLHIGCGDNARDGWLDSDLFPRSPNIFHLDATRPFPFRDAMFDLVFSEHMIEHIPYSSGLRMLCECHRVLKPGGTVRISTPDLSFLIALHGDGKSDIQQRYIEWSTREFISDAPFPADTFVINNFVRDWGHVFIYDEKTLRASLEFAGFTNITRCSLNESRIAGLRNLENERRMPDGFLALETMTLEGTRPD